ncbi:11322_t:CDS:2, partial [Paraglomus brasilianum]
AKTLLETMYIGGSDAKPNSSEIQGIKHILNRPKNDPIDFLPEDDIASMRDVFDVMDDNEILTRQLASGTDTYKQPVEGRSRDGGLRLAKWNVVVGLDVRRNGTVNKARFIDHITDESSI